MTASLYLLQTALSLLNLQLVPILLWVVPVQSNDRRIIL